MIRWLKSKEAYEAMGWFGIGGVVTLILQGIFWITYALVDIIIMEYSMTNTIYGNYFDGNTITEIIYDAMPGLIMVIGGFCFSLGYLIYNRIKQAKKVGVV